MIDWHSQGYTRGLACITGAPISTMYPTLDKYTQQDEAEYIRGYNQAYQDATTKGITSLEAYADEKEINLSLTIK